MQEIKISNGYIQSSATYLRSLQIEPLEADFLQDVHEALVPLIDQPFATQVPLELLNQLLLRTRQHLNCPQLIFEIVQVIRPEHFPACSVIWLCEQQRCGNDPEYHSLSTTGD